MTEVSHHTECLDCGHAQGWHRQNFGACIECCCTYFHYAPQTTFAEITRLESEAASLRQALLEAREALEFVQEWYEGNMKRPEDKSSKHPIAARARVWLAKWAKQVGEE